MEWLKKINNAIDYIENNLDSEISYDEAAQIACCSTYYFQRMFTYITGISLAEYSFINKITDDYFETTTRLLKGEYGFMCQYEDPNFQTVWSSIFNLKSLMVYRAEGDPRKKKFVTDSRLHDIKFGK